MAEQEANEAYEILLGWLRNSDLNWVAEQIENEIALGKIRSERISVEKVETRPLQTFSIQMAADHDSKKQAGRSSAEFLARVEYDPFEKFEIAAGAVEAVVSGAIKIQKALVTLLSPSSAAITINFVPGETGDSAYSVQMEELENREQHASLLDNYFVMLRKDVRDAD
jgi:hypothetical protein